MATTVACASPPYVGPSCRLLWAAISTVVPWAMGTSSNRCPDVGRRLAGSDDQSGLESSSAFLLLTWSSGESREVRASPQTPLGRWRAEALAALALVAESTGAPWYVSNRQIHEDLGVPLFADHIRALTASFYSKLADVGNPLVRHLDRYADRGLTPSPDAKAKGGRGQQATRGHRPRWPSRENQSRSDRLSAFRLP